MVTLSQILPTTNIRAAAPVFIASVVIGLAGLIAAPAAKAGPPGGNGTTMQECVNCHAGQAGVDLHMPFANGEVVLVDIDPAEFSASVHGSILQCQACHQEMGGYPHPDRRLLYNSPREPAFLMRQYAVCGGCHPQAYADYLGSAHAQALTAGNGEAAVCSDCHGAHDIEAGNAETAGLALRPAVYRCGKCHAQQFSQYRHSVHGRPLLELGDPNAPACVDCHGVHNIVRPTTAEFRRQSPYLCATCHADRELMRRYGLSTQIMDTYVADFHGTSAHLFPLGQGQTLNQAVCHDCHGVHDIRSTIDPNSSIMRDNLLVTCQKCHADATINFPQAWIGHYEPTPYQNAPVYWIKSIYNIIFTLGMAGFIGHIVLDMGRVTVDKVKNERRTHD